MLVQRQDGSSMARAPNTSSFTEAPQILLKIATNQFRVEAFQGYVLLLHIWIWVVLHRAAAVHSAHTIAKPVAPG